MKQENMKKIYVTISGWTDGSGWDYTNDPIDPMPMYASSTPQEIIECAKEYVIDFAANEAYKEGSDVEFRFYSDPDDDEPICKFWLNEYINRGARYISLDNGVHWLTAAEAMPEIEERNVWYEVAQMMDDETREDVHNCFAPCSNLEFLTEYLRRAQENLIIG